MAHELNKHFGINVQLRYQCPCDGKEVIALQVIFDARTFENEEHFLDIMRSARRDMIVEINQHIKDPK